MSEISSKSSKVDMVTNVDRAVEEHIVREILNSRPADGILGEEGAAVDGSSGYRWIIDPVDGTTNMLFGVRAYAVVLAVERAGAVELGVIHDVAADVTYWAARGEGAYREGKPIVVSGATQLDTSLIATGFSYNASQRRKQAERLVGVLPSVRDIRRFGSAALDLCRVASGEVDGYFEDALKRWDYEAGVLLVKEAGGRVSDRDGLVIATGPGIHALLAELLTTSGSGERAAST